MSRGRTLLRVLDEFLWVLRRAGFEIATSQAIDTALAVQLVGFGDRAQLRDSIAAVVVTKQADRARFDAEFDRFFSSKRDARSLWERLAGRGFEEREIAILKELLGAMAQASAEAPLLPGSSAGAHSPLGALLERGPELDRLLRSQSSMKITAAMQSSMQGGFFTHRILSSLGYSGAHAALGQLRSHLADALSAERADLLVTALKAELERASDDVRRFVKSTFDRRLAERAQEREATGSLGVPGALDPEQSLLVRRAVRRFLERLTGGAKVRARRARMGRFDAHRTLAQARRTQFVPLRVVRKRKPPQKPELFVLCDVSDSVRTYAAFLLEFAYEAQALTKKTRTFVFLSDLGETTDLFRAAPVREALAQAYSGRVISVSGNSNYGRVLSELRSKHMKDISQRSTVVILGDGRTNYLPDGAEHLAEIVKRARRVFVLTPEGREQWGAADSALSRYAQTGATVLEVSSALSLMKAAREFLR